MNYTNDKRKKLNAHLKKLFPDVQWNENVYGVRSMMTDDLPAGFARARNLDELEDAAYKHKKKYRMQIPVLMKMSNDFQHRFVVGYVDYMSEQSMERADSYIRQGRLHYYKIES